MDCSFTGTIRITLIGTPHRVYRIGVGRLTLFRFFPNWFYEKLHVPYHVTQGLGYHFFFMWIFAVNGVIYVLYTWLSGEWRFLLPQRRSLQDAVQVTPRGFAPA